MSEDKLPLPEATEARVVREPSAAYNRNTEIPTFFGEPMLKGVFDKLDLTQFNSEVPTRYYHHPKGEIWCGDAIAWMRSLPDESADLIFADPPYNLKKAEWDSFE